MTTILKKTQEIRLVRIRRGVGWILAKACSYASTNSNANNRLLYWRYQQGKEMLDVSTERVSCLIQFKIEIHWLVHLPKKYEKPSKTTKRGSSFQRIFSATLKKRRRVTRSRKWEGGQHALNPLVLFRGPCSEHSLYCKGMKEQQKEPPGKQQLLLIWPSTWNH